MEENTVASVFDELSQDQPSFQYATVGQRFVHYLVDNVAFYVLNYLVFTCIRIFISQGPDSIVEYLSNRFVVYTIMLVNRFILYTLVEGATKGRSLGKLVTGTVVVKNDFSEITWGDAAKRTLCRFIPFDQLSAFGGNPWHDQLTRTHVIKKDRLTL